jgi:antirestriction factor ArdC-like protein
MAKTKRRLSEAERAERRQRDRERLQRAAEQLLTSEGWQRWVRVRSQAGLARLSLSNQLLVALARPDATFVAGFKGWLRLGYCVKKSERAIAIIAPMPVKERDRVSSDETGETIVLFKTVFVFDRAQVAPVEGAEQAPLDPPCEPLTGDSHHHLIAPLRAFTESLGFTVSFEAIEGSAGGWCDFTNKRIVVDIDAPANAQLRTLIHETIHGLGVGYAEYGRERAEVIVDTATHLACASVGLWVDGESVPYVAGWGEDGALEAVTEFAKLIDTLARRVETVLLGSDGDPPASTGVPQPLPGTCS